jgi:hypothetical protein
MGEPQVRELFRTAIATNDAAAMRAGLELLLGISGSGLSPEREHELRRPDFVMEMPQSGERVRGRDAMRQLQERFPVPGGPAVTLRRVVGGHRVWVVEAAADYGDDPWLVVVIFELDDTGLIARETRYYTQRLDAPEWRAGLVEAMDESTGAGDGR